MNQRLFAVRILPGKTEQARDFLRALEGERREELAACAERLGVTKEVWAIQSGPQDGLLICYFAAGDVERVRAEFPALQEGFDAWFDAQLTGIAGPGWGRRYTGEILADYET